MWRRMRLLSTPLDSSFNSLTSDVESSLNSNVCRPVVEKAYGNDSESSIPPPNEDCSEVCMTTPSVMSSISTE